MNETIRHPSRLASRWSGIRKSIFSEMTQLAQQYNAINLGQGFPDFHGPKKILECISQQVMTCHNQYSPSAGEIFLREQVSKFVEKQIGVCYNPQTEITITSGASEALYSSINAFVNPGDRVLIFEPAFDLYVQAIANAGGTPIPVRLHAPDTPVGMANDNKWSIDWHEFDAVAAGGFSHIIFNSPHNPTGKIFSEEEMDRIATKILKNEAIVLADEVYENLIYNDVSYLSLAAFSKIQHLVVRISSAAKTFGFTGLKVGWACAPKSLTESIRLVHQATVFCISPFTQLGLANAMQDEKWFDNYLQSQKEIYQQKKDFLTSALEKAGYFVSNCEGTFFLMANYEKLAGGDISDLDYSRKLIETHRIATIPISPFYIRPPKNLPWVRFAFCKQDETLNFASKFLLK